MTIEREILEHVRLIGGICAGEHLRQDTSKADYFLPLCSDAESFFRAVIRALPLDPPLSGKVHWDALADSLFYGLIEGPAKNIQIYWQSPGVFFKNDLESFSLALRCLSEVGRLLADRDPTCGNIKNMECILLDTDNSLSGFELPDA
jgi:hypothetical protein